MVIVGVAEHGLSPCLKFLADMSPENAFVGKQECIVKLQKNVVMA